MDQQSHSWAYIQRTPSFEKIPAIPMFIAALFTIGKTCKQPKCPSTEEWIKKMWYIYTREYYSAIKKGGNNAICRNMDTSEKDQYHMLTLICGL